MSDGEKRRLDDSDSDADNEKDELLLSRGSSSSESHSASPEAEPVDPRFNRPAPSPFKRAALLLLIAVLVWVAVQMRSGLLEAKRKPQIIYASRSGGRSQGFRSTRLTLISLQVFKGTQVQACGEPDYH